MKIMNKALVEYLERKLKQGKRIELEYNHQTDEVKVLEHKITRVKLDNKQVWGYTMKKNISIAEMKQELARQKTRLEAFETVMDKLDEAIKWNCMNIKRDEDGEAIHDENGEYVFEAPQEGEYKYEEYIALTGVRDEIMAII